LAVILVIIILVLMAMFTVLPSWQSWCINVEWCRNLSGVYKLCH